MAKKVGFLSLFAACLWCLLRPIYVQGKLLATDSDISANLNYSIVQQRAESDMCKQNEVCVASVECLVDVDAQTTLKPCSTVPNGNGVCCSLIWLNGTQSRFQDRFFGDPTDYLMINAIQEGRREFDEKLRHEYKHQSAMTAKKKPESTFHRMLHPGNMPHSMDNSNKEEQVNVYGHVFASRKFAQLANMTLEDRQADRFARVPRAIRKRCLQPVSCNPKAKYRTIDGSCNNPLPERSSWGMVGYPNDRVLPPAYEDGVWAPRIHSVSGNLLPSARTVSTTLFPDAFWPDHCLNILFMQMGQFISHDITLGRGFTLQTGGSIECCAPDHSGPLSGPKRHFACLPIDVSPKDPFYSQFGVRCLNLVRLQLSQGPECELGFAKQANSVTHFLDASSVYGSTNDQAKELRLFQKGRMRNSLSSGTEQLPFSKNPKSCVPWARVCYEGGDIRANQLLALTITHTLFIREHNRLAVRLSQVNPHWDDEKLYQEARRIVIAEYQNIVFNEFLPILLGKKNVQLLHLVDPFDSYSNFYNPDHPPMVLTEVVAAAHRYGHSLVEGFFRFLTREEPPEDVPIRSIFNNPSKTLERNSFDVMLFSFGQQPMESMDRFITTGLSRFLFQERNPFGSDLASINCQRGRDVAVRSYNDYREWAGQDRITDFSQLGEVGALLAQVYESPDDVDLWPGGVLEPPANDAVVGPTFAALLAEGYSRFKFGDRYYFTNGPDVNPGAFTLQQLGQVRRTTLASLICANVDHKQDFYQAPQAFMQSSKKNVPIPCTNYNSLQLDAWREKAV